MRDSVDQRARMLWMSVTSCMRLIKGVLGGGRLDACYLLRFFRQVSSSRRKR
jgi:hypothetical protein